jgi:hypothetical protein
VPAKKNCLIGKIGCDSFDAVATLLNVIFDNQQNGGVRKTADCQKKVVKITSPTTGANGNVPEVSF